jgi:ribosome-associated protein
MMSVHSIELRGDFVELHALLKLLALAPSGGAAKAMIAAGEVSVDGQTETRKARKIRAGQVVRVGEEEVRVA